MNLFLVLMVLLVVVANAEQPKWVDVFEMVDDENQTRAASLPTGGSETFPHGEACKRQLHFILKAITDPLLLAECHHPERAQSLSLDGKRIRLALQILNESAGNSSTGDSLLDALSQIRVLSESFFIKTQKTRKVADPIAFFSLGRFRPSDQILHNVLLVGAVGLLSYLLVWLAGTVGTRRVFNRLLLVTFVSGVIWNWYNLYLKAIARKRADLVQSVGYDACMQSDNVLASVYKAMRGLFVSQNLECQRYYEAILVAPITEVSPTQALSVTVVKFFVEPAQILGEAVAKLIAGSRRDVPTMLQPVSVAITLLLVLFMIVLLFGFSINTPVLSISKPQQRLQQRSQERIVRRQPRPIQHGGHKYLSTRKRKRLFARDSSEHCHDSD